MARVIAITGIDGSGKTSTARKLQHRLAEVGFRARYVHQFDSVFARALNALRAFRPAKTTRPSGAPVQAGSNRPRKASYFNRLAGYAFLLLQALAANRARFSRNDFLVCDRYFYDDFVRMRQRYAISERYFFLVEKLVPRPVLLVALEGDARATYDRQVDIDTTFGKYVEKLGIHNATIDQLRRLGLATLAIDTTKTPQPEVLQIIMHTLEETSVI